MEIDAEAKEWLILPRNGVKAGPLSIAEMRQKRLFGELGPGIKLRLDGDPEWIAWAHVALVYPELLDAKIVDPPPKEQPRSVIYERLTLGEPERRTFTALKTMAACLQCGSKYHFGRCSLCRRNAYVIEQLLEEPDKSFVLTCKYCKGTRISGFTCDQCGTRYSIPEGLFVSK